jgi:hypothetical protein
MGALNNLETIYPSEISKPSRGLYKPMNAGGDDSVVVGDTEQNRLLRLALKYENPSFTNLSRSG